MGKTMRYWYIKGLGYLAKAEYRAKDGLFLNPEIYNHASKKWVEDKSRKLFQCLNGKLPGCDAEKVFSNREVHELKQIENIALRFAEDVHEGQLDEDGSPVIEHSKAVAAMLNDSYEKTLAYLHDVLENTTYTVSDIRNAFGDEIAERVDLLTYNPWDDYIDDYLWRIADDSIATKVKIADLARNLQRARKHPERYNKKQIRKHECGITFLDGFRED